MKLTCRYYQKSLASYVYGQLEQTDPDRYSKLERHLATCDKCRSDASALAAADRLMELHARASVRPVHPRSGVSMSNRVLQAIQPEDRYLSPVRWTPSMMSFVGVAVFAGLFITIINPSSGARSWFQANMLDDRHGAVKHVAPFSSTNDPFTVGGSSLTNATRNVQPAKSSAQAVTSDAGSSADPTAATTTLMSPMSSEHVGYEQPFVHNSVSSADRFAPKLKFSSQANSPSNSTQGRSAVEVSVDGRGTVKPSGVIDDSSVFKSVMPADSTTDLPPSPPPALPVSNASALSDTNVAPPGDSDAATKKDDSKTKGASSDTSTVGNGLSR